MQKNKEILVILTLTVFVCILLIFFFIGDLSLKEFGISILKMIVPTEAANAVNPSMLRYHDRPVKKAPLVFISGLALLIVLVALCVRAVWKNKRMPGLEDIILTGILLVLFFISMRSVFQIVFISQIHKQHADGVSLAQQYQRTYGVVDRFSRQIKKVVHGRKTAVLVTGYDAVKDMQTRVQLAYLLYPIDIRNIRNQQADVYLILNKENALKNIPSGFRVLKQLDDRSLIAIRELP